MKRTCFGLFGVPGSDRNPLCRAGEDTKFATFCKNKYRIEASQLVYEPVLLWFGECIVMSSLGNDKSFCFGMYIRTWLQVTIHSTSHTFQSLALVGLELWLQSAQASDFSCTHRTPPPNSSRLLSRARLLIH